MIKNQIAAHQKNNDKKLEKWEDMAFEPWSLRNFAFL